MKAESRGREILTGLFVIAGIAILVTLTLWVTGSDLLGGGESTYEILMKDAGGVRPGDQVRVAGIPVGRVDSVDLRTDAEWPVSFRVTLKGKIPVTTQSRAHLASDGLLGARFLSIDPGPAEASPLAAGKAIKGSASSDISQVVGRVNEVADRAVTLMEETTQLMRQLSRRVDPLLARFDALLSEENVEQLSATLEALRRTLEETGPRLPELLARLESTLGEIEAGVETVPELTTEARALVTDLRTALGPEGERLQTLLDSAGGTLDDASETLGAVAGNAGDLEAAMRDLRTAAANLRALSQALKERPNRLLITPRKADRRPGDGVDR